jgi:hypothetical protein
MRYRQGISRRRMLAVTAAAGGIGAGGFGGQFGLVSGASAQAQAAKRLDQFDPTLDNIISTSEPIKELASGLGVNVRVRKARTRVMHVDRIPNRTSPPAFPNAARSSRT